MTDIFSEQTKLTHRVEGLVNQFKDELTATLEGALEEVEARLLLLSAKAEETPSHLRRKAYLEKQREELQKVLNEIYKDIGEGIKTRVVQLAQAMPGIIHKIVVESLPVSFTMGMSVPKLSKKEVVAWFESSQIEGSFFNDWMKKLESNTVDRVISESRRSLVLHESPTKTAKRLQEALNVSRHSASTLLNTALQEAVNYAELEYYRENAERIPKVMFVAELDRHTCGLCRNLDLQVFDIKKAQQSRPPLHLSCRCRLFPVFTSMDIYGLEKTKRVTRKDTKPRTIHHKDGTTSTTYEDFETELVPWKTTYNDWMTSMVKSSDPKDRTFAREALGKTRFELVKSGKLEMNSLYYGGRLRTIKELEELT
jgi:SPP1 gp7 family putative phage head morphogenesis protein